MTKTKTDEKREKMAIFRYGVISELVGDTHMVYGEMEEKIQQKAQQQWNIPDSTKTSISASTIRRWVRQYRQGGSNFWVLAPSVRQDIGASRVVDPETALSLIKLKQSHPQMPVRQLIAKMEELDLIPPGQTLCASTAYRILHKEGLTKRSPKDKTDRRRYEAAYPNDVWQSDVMHGPRVLVNGKQCKTYLIAFLDDHSRLVPHGEFYPQENISRFLDAFRQALLTRGIPRKLYVDNGAAFRSHHLDKVCASLGISKVHSEPYKPQGRGKIERFFRTVRLQFESGFTGKTLEDLNMAFDRWLQDQYHQHPHSSTSESPQTRFGRHMDQLRTPPKNLEDHFRKEARRRVTRDRTISLGNKLYEAPATLIGEQVELLYHADDSEQVEIIFQGKSHGMLRLLDKKVNCVVARERPTGNEPVVPAPKSGKLNFKKGQTP